MCVDRGHAVFEHIHEHALFCVFTLFGLPWMLSSRAGGGKGKQVSQVLCVKWPVNHKGGCKKV